MTFRFSFYYSRVLFICLSSVMVFWVAVIPAYSFENDKKEEIFDEKTKIKLTVAVDSFMHENKESKILVKKIENYILTAILKNTDVVLADKNFDACLSIVFKTAAAFSKNEEECLCVISAAGVPSSSFLSSHSFLDREVAFHEMFSFKMLDIIRTCSRIADLYDEKVLSGIRESKKRAALRRAIEEKTRREEYERELKKQREVRRIEEARAWKEEKYRQWKSNKSMSILDEELEAAGVTFEQLLKEFKEMDARR